MKQFRLKNLVPECYNDDVQELCVFIREKLGIHITRTDAYLFWNMVSESWCASWLSIDAHYEGETREEFLLEKLEEYGYLIDDELNWH